MPQVNFYILQATDQRDNERFICRLVEKAWLQNYKIYINTNSIEQTRRLDDLLWTFKQESFLPHDIYPDVIHSVAPIRIGHVSIPTDTHLNANVLVNLTNDVPHFFNQFERIAEIVMDETMREAGRSRYRFYRDQGFELNTHNITTF